MEADPLRCAAMGSLADLRTPALLLDLDKLDANLRRMAGRCERLGVALRPHLKTHKSLAVARRQAAAGCRGATVATLEEARFFADGGLDDLTWAFPVIPGRIAEARALAERVTLRLTVDSTAAVDLLEAERFPFHVWLKVDCGYHRAGVDPQDPAALELARRLDTSPTLRFDGLLTHSGHAYKASTPDAVRAVAEQERSVMTGLAARLRRAGVTVSAVSVGSTPAMTQVSDLTGVTEARPGNYVFYDRTQVLLGSCAVADCAVTVLTTVISSSGSHAVVDAGALALSKDPGPTHLGRPTMGEVFADYPAGELEEGLRLTELSQEHGRLSAPRPVGERLRVLPNHSCLTVACFDHYEVVRGDEVVARWPICRAR